MPPLPPGEPTILTNGIIPQFYLPPTPTGTRKIGALLDDECHRMVLKPRKAAGDISQLLQEWKAVRRNDGSVVYVL